jgi:hypothetical protein
MPKKKKSKKTLTQNVARNINCRNEEENMHYISNASSTENPEEESDVDSSPSPQLGSDTGEGAGRGCIFCMRVCIYWTLCCVSICCMYEIFV